MYLQESRIHSMTQQMAMKTVRAHFKSNKCVSFASNVAKFLETFKRAQATPRQKYPLPQTEAQEIGWDITPLVCLIS